jgi:nitrite reductase/ring-hydroxylating ferredoxin subunit
MANVKVAASGEIVEGALRSASHAGTKLLLTRVGGRVYAVENKCPHLGMSLARGTLSGSTLRCPWHGSRFDVCTGANQDWANAVAGIPMPSWMHSLIAMGKKPAPLRTLKATESQGHVYVEVPS